VRVFLDHNVPKRLRRLLPGHEVRTAHELSWAELTNGQLVNAVEGAGFTVFVTGDKNLSYQQNLVGRKIALVVLSENSRKILMENAEPIKAAVDAATPGSFQTVLLPRPSRH
jgi:hypothetical protein